MKEPAERVEQSFQCTNTKMDLKKQVEAFIDDPD